MKRAALPLLAMLCTVSPASAGMMETILTLDGSLSKKDQTLPNGEFMDTYPITLEAGDRVIIDMRSRKVDTYLVLRSPSGENFENDDLDGDRDHSQIELIAEESGVYLIIATSAMPREKGKYSVRAAVDSSGRGQVASASGPEIVPIAPGERTTGTLGPGDYTLPNGEWADLYVTTAQAGQLVTVDMTSDDADTYVVLRSPSGETIDNDDWEGSSSRSRIEHFAEESGEWQVFATTYREGQGGAYVLSVETGQPAAETVQDGPERWSGALDGADTVISTGEFAEVISVEGQAGEHWVVDLRSNEFDPFLIVKAPSGEQLENDDFEGDSSRSLLDFELSESGTYTIGVTTYQPGETGAFDMTLRRAEGITSVDNDHSGTLAEGDEQLSDGEWFDIYTFEGVPGQHVNIEMSGDFDTYLGLVGPTSFKEENDDGDSSRHSQIEAVLTEAGTYRVVATSYQAGQGGSYDLSIDVGESTDAVETQRDVTSLTSGQVATGRLQDGDLTLESGEYKDVYTIEAAAGQVVSVTMRSADFDTYVGLQMPDGSVVENDDWEGSSSTSFVEVTAPESGRYRVIATSYRPGDSGEYTVEAAVGGEAAAPASHHAVTGDQGEIYGVFVGISDYPSDGPSDLDFTADDAISMATGLQQIGMPEGNATVLTDSAATRDAVFSAIREQSARMGDDDLLVVFYSGHGGRQARSEPQAADPDGFDETLALYDGQVTDDEVAAVFSEINDGKVLLVLDSCFSGGFSKDIISRPDRMGLFSSHEDVTSAVAVKFRAGGYLARFMTEAIGERRADFNGDSSLTSLELSQYLYERYRSDVKGDFGDKADVGAYDDIVMTGRNLGYQQLIVDRGSVGPSQVLFAW